MNTVLLKLDPDSPDPAALEQAAQVLCRGGLVAFPTETVYGLGALALNSDAVSRIFEAKGRPASNPVIVHAGSVDQVRSVAAHWPESAARLAAQFWPGPLTLVLPRRESVPDIVTAGGPTVAVRIPSHPVALALIRAAGQPIAAPSANRSMAVSPTRAEHVLRTLRGRIEMVLDGGPCSGGIESTVLLLNSDGSAKLLRPGLVTPKEIESVLEAPVHPVGIHRMGEDPIGKPFLPSPGMLERHYAPNADLTVVEGSGLAEVEGLTSGGTRVGWLPFASDAGNLPHIPGVKIRAMPAQPDQYASALYDALHSLDAEPVDRIVVARPPEREEWEAVHDRLRRASAPKSG